MPSGQPNRPRRPDGCQMKFKIKQLLFTLPALFFCGCLGPKPAQPVSWPGEKIDTWNGFTRHTFTVDGCAAWVVEPKTPLPGRPWSWCMEFPDAFVERCAAPQLLAKGFYHAHISVGNTFGCPDALKHFNAFYDAVRAQGLAPKVALIGISRGGLYAYRWAAENPGKVSAIYGDAPVCDFKSWPGGKGKGIGSKNDWDALMTCYHFKDEAEALAYRGNPIDILTPLAEAGVPLIHVVGDADDVVPVAENTAIIQSRYQKIGGEIQVIHKPGVGHHPHGLDDPTPVVDFIVSHTLKPSTSGYAFKTFTGAQGSLPYRILSPATIKAGERYPLVLFLHGAGERGTDNQNQLRHGGPLFLDPKNREVYPAFVVFPQCPENKRWVEVDWIDPKPHHQPKEPSVPMSLVLELLPLLEKSLPIDPSRAYVMGLSMGGFGTWDIAARHPDWFAAAVPICGGADNSTAPSLAALPIWAFHGAQDSTVPTSRTRSMIEALKEAGGKPKYTEYPGVNHDAWTPALAEPGLLPWMFAQNIQKTPVASGPFKPTVESLKQYRCPDWFRDAKFGIWAVWGPESVPMNGDWYARRLYEEGSPDYQDHLKRFGHPSTNGWKDIIPLWHAEKWDPDRLMGLYQKAGAKYFCMIAMHHDNFDCWDSKFQRWNSVNIGPKRDIAGDWQKAAQKHGLRFGMTEHLAASWWFYSAAKRADTNGPLAGVRYDGADPKYSDLYWVGNEKPDGNYYLPNAPDFVKKIWFNRIKNLVDRYHPDLLYSDSPLPYPDEFGQKLLAHYYNDNTRRHGGKLEAVYNCKQEPQGRWVQDLERGVMDGISPNPWQTDTCVGDWYYQENLLKTHRYRSTAMILQMLADIVSKNGNLLLNLPPRPDGTLDDDELKILSELAAWMPVNGEAIFGTRPWKLYGEGPSKMKQGGSFNENTLKYTAKDIRFTTRGKTLYALALGWPEGGKLVVKSLATPAGKVSSVVLLGHIGKLDWAQTEEGLMVMMPSQKPCEHVFTLKIAGSDLKPSP